jgi:molecular chaperone GrpE (heat shock protein)
LGDAVLLVAAWLLYAQAGRPMNPSETVLFGVCVGLGAWLGVWPFVLRHQAELKRLEVHELAAALAQINQAEEIARQIGLATGQWQTVQEHAGRVMTAAREIADRMAVEQKEFKTFLEHANNTERDHLRLEVNKLRRAESDWLQVLVRVLDHVYALYLAGVRSGQAQLSEQLGGFQNACRDAARRVGLVPIVAGPGTAFDAEVHQLADANAVAPAPALVSETLATGYAFQGRLLRRALVQLQAPPAPAGQTVPETVDRPQGPVE